MQGASLDRKRHHCEDDLRELDSMRKSLSVEVARAELVRRPWVEQFKAALDGEGQDSRESGSGGGRLGLPPALVEAAFGRRQAAKRDGGQLAEATAAAMEMLCGALRAMEELDVHRLLHILKWAVNFLFGATYVVAVAIVVDRRRSGEKWCLFCVCLCTMCAGARSSSRWALRSAKLKGSTAGMRDVTKVLVFCNPEKTVSSQKPFCSPFKKPLDRILSKIFFYLDSVSDWRKVIDIYAKKERVCRLS